MLVKDLIAELLDHDMDAVVEVGISSTEENDDFEFDIHESNWSRRNYVTLKVNLTDYVLVNKNAFDDTEKHIEKLETELNDLKTK